MKTERLVVEMNVNEIVEKCPMRWWMTQKRQRSHGFNRGKPRKKGTILIEENRERKRKGKRINF